MKATAPRHALTSSEAGTPRSHTPAVSDSSRPLSDSLPRNASHVKVSDNSTPAGGVHGPLLSKLLRTDQGYPSRLTDALGSGAPSFVTALGNVEILQRHKLALFCSVRCPGRLILATYDLAQALREADVALVGGFHSPMERECLAILLKGPGSVVICPARAFGERSRVPAEWRSALGAGRLVVLSPFDERERRVTAELALERNRFIAALADEILFAYAAPGSRTEAFAREVAGRGKLLLTLEGTENAGLVALGARPVSRYQAPT